ncbi:MAG: cytochrome P450, partial [Bradyrhizobium sp.]
MDTNVPKPLMQCGSRDRYAQFTRWLGHYIQSRRLAFHMRLYRVSCFFLCHLGYLKFGFGLLRRIRPVFIFKKVLVVTRASEVREVLQRFDDFTLGDFI